MGGEHVALLGEPVFRVGSSPRGRGTLRRRPASRFHQRIIPAWAGNTHTVQAGRRGTADHPRVGGEHADLGNPIAFQQRIIPAWAGNTIRSGPTSGMTSDHPRVGGEHGDCAQDTVAYDGSSPRGRGTRTRTRGRLMRLRIIPAWAGNTMDSAGRCRAMTDHPRVGGEHDGTNLNIYPVVGSSPRGRGTR